MITAKDLSLEIKNMEKEALILRNDVFQKTVVKGITLGLKMLHSMRTNQTLMMKAQGIDLKKNMRRDGEENKQQTEGE